MHFVAIDIGSSYLKGAVVDMNALRLSHIAREPFPAPAANLPSGCFEVEPQAVVDASRRLLLRLLEHAPDCLGIVASTQMGGLVLADRRLRPLTRYISWRDQRTVLPGDESSASSFTKFLEAVGPDDARRLGRDLKPGYMTSLLHWLKLQNRLPHDPAYALSIGDFVIASLAADSNAVPRTHPTSACGGVDVTCGDWAAATWRRLGLDSILWPEMAGLATVVGRWQVGGRSIRLYPALGDHACALAGVLLEEGELSLNISTGSQVSQLTSTFAPGDYQTRPYLDQRLLNTITHIPAGRSLNVLVDLLTEWSRAQATELGLTPADPWPYIAQAAEEAGETELDVDLSFFAGPLGEQGHVRGITTDNLRIGTLFRAAFRSMATNYALLAGRVAPNRNWSRLVFSGGLAQNLELLRRLIRESLPGECRVSPETEDTLRGLLIAAMVASGRAATVVEATQLLSKHT